MSQHVFDFAVGGLGPYSGSQLRDRGVERSAQSANRFGLQAQARGERWVDVAYALLQEFVQQVSGEFMSEDIREFAYAKGLERPPSERAWGSVITRAAREGLMQRVGTRSVKNARAHCANAAVWKRRQN